MDKGKIKEENTKLETRNSKVEIRNKERKRAKKHEMKKNILLLTVLIVMPFVSAVELEAGELPFDLSGFVEGAYGSRYKSDPYQEDITLSEIRLQAEIAKEMEIWSLMFKGDLYYDDVLSSWETDIREANLFFLASDAIELKAGRQILTWGTGDLLFINDLFPKDWPSFFIGRESEYLKAPSDALKVSFFPEAFSLDIVFTPQFDASRAITGERISYYNPFTGELAGKDAVISAEEPDEWLMG